MSKLESMSFEHRGGRSKTSRSKEQQPKQSEKTYELRQTYQLNFNKVVGKDVTIDFNAYNFFINQEPMQVGDTVILFENGVVKIGKDKELSILEFLVYIGIGLQEGAFTIQDYVAAAPENRINLEESENLPN